MSDDVLLSASRGGPKLNDDHKIELYLKYLQFKKKF